MSFMARRVGMPQVSLRTPISCPPLFGNLAIGSGRDSLPVLGNLHDDGGVQRLPAAGDSDLTPGSRAQPVAEKQQKRITDNVMALGNDPAIFQTVTPPSQQPTCHTCGLSGSRKCSQCHVTYYCSMECQRLDWKAHSIICKPAAVKETNGEKLFNNNNGETKTFTKPCEAPPPSRVKEEEGRRVMLCDLKVETLSEGTEIKGYVSDFCSPSDFSVQEYNAKSIENLMKLSALLKNVYSSPENLRKDYVPQIREVCAAKYSKDQQWYRVLVNNVERSMSKAQVLYLDYGNQETLSLCDLQPMRGDLELTPPCAMQFGVAHSLAPPYGWSPECLVEVKRLLMGQQLEYRIVHVDQQEIPRYSVEVSLPETGKLLHKVMEEKGYSFVSHIGRRSQEISTESGDVPMTLLCPSHEHDGHVSPVASLGEAVERQNGADGGGNADSPRVGDRFQVLITVFHNPEMFFCQRVHNAKQLGELVTAMNKRCRETTATLISLPEPGEVCCAQYTGDGNWYRASVLKHKSDDTALVGYLDFGNTETLHISALRPIDIDLLQTPFQAIQCRLAGVKPPSGSWSPESIFAIGLVLINKIFSALVISDSAGALTLDLVAESTSPPLPVSQHLIAAGLAEDEKSLSVRNEGEEPGEEPREEPRETSSGLTWAQLALNQETEVMVCMLRSPGDFYCHRYDPTDVNSLNDLNVSLGQYCKDHVTEGHTPITGDVCGAFFSEDGSWYRGQVKGITSGGAVAVQFLDYGNAEEVPMDKLCKIPSSFLELPFQAVRCSLAGVKPAGEMWDLRATEKFQKSVARIKLRAKAVSRKEDGYCVQLVVSESGEAVTDVLLAENLAIPDDLKTVGTNLTTAQEAGDGGSGSVCDLQEDKLTKETKADSGIRPQNDSAHREPDSSHSVQPIKSTQPTYKANSATVTPQEAISLNTTTVLNPPGSAAPTLHGGPKSGYSTSPFQGKHNSNINESSSGNPSPPAFQGKHNSNTNESSSGNPSPPAFQGKYNSNTRKSSSFGNLSPKPFQTIYNSNTKESSSGNLPSIFQRKPNSNVEESSSSGNLPSPPSQRKYNSNTESFSGNPSPPAFQGKYNPNTKDSSSGNHPPCDYRGFRASESPSPSQSRPVSTYGTRSPMRSGFISAKNSPSSPREMKSTCVSHLPPQAESPCHESKPPSEKDLPTGDSAQRDVQSSKCPSASQPATSACEDQPNPAREPSSGLLEAGGVSTAQSWTSIDLPMNESLAAGVIRVRSPDLLYVFPKQNRVDVEKLQEVMTDILRYCNEEAEHPDYMPCVGDACCAKFTGDGQWYRAVILEVSVSTVTVVYADYGNLETLPLSCLRPIKESFLRLPVQITRCRLCGVTPLSHGWSPEESQALSNLLLGAELILTAHSLEGGIYSVSVEKIPGAERETLITGELTKATESTPSTQICKGNCVSWRICEELREIRRKIENVELLLEKLMMK